MFKGEGPKGNYKKLDRDLNIKVWGLKHNYEKKHGNFCKIARTDIEIKEK
jgi:hypothetical protein